jgi:hypothetical protein
MEVDMAPREDAKQNGESRSTLHDELARWIEQRRASGAIPRAEDGWPDVEAWRDAARSDGYDCTSDDMRQAIRIALLFRRVMSSPRPPVDPS